MFLLLARKIKLLFSLTIFLWLEDRFFTFQNNPKNLDMSYKMDLDLWGCLGRVKLITKFHRKDLVI